MKHGLHSSHNVRRLVFWLLLASAFGMGLVLLFWLPHHPLSGGLALGFLALLVLKHIGLALIVGSPLVGAINVARVRLKGLWSRRGGPSDAP
jgi:hypothetical protein